MRLLHVSLPDGRAVVLPPVPEEFPTLQHLVSVLLAYRVDYGVDYVVGETESPTGSALLMVHENSLTVVRHFPLTYPEVENALY